MTTDRFLIRHLAAALNAPVVAAALFEHRVGFWHIGTGELIRVLDTCLDFGGRRLAISDDGSLCFTGSYGQGVVECFEVGSGQVKWRSHVVEHVQDLAVSPSSGLLYCCDDNSDCFVFDMCSGEHLFTIKGVKRVFVGGPTGTRARVTKKTLLLETNDQPSVSIELLSFAVLDVCFVLDRVCVSESAGPVRCFLLDGPRQLWQYTPPIGSHVSRVAYCEARKSWVAILRRFSNSTESTLISLDAANGAPECLCELGVQPVIAFVNSADGVICSDGRIVGTSSGVVIDLVDFSSGFRA